MRAGRHRREAPLDFHSGCDPAHVPEAEWKEGRRRVLQGFLDRERLYGSDPFHAQFEQRSAAERAAMRTWLRALRLGWKPWSRTAPTTRVG